MFPCSFTQEEGITDIYGWSAGAPLEDAMATDGSLQNG